MKTTLLSTLVLLTSTATADIHSASIHSAMTLRHRESEGVGYNQGYSTLDYYLTSQHDNLEFLLNLRGHLFNNAKAAGNGGLGFRYSLKEDTSRIGVNLFYDVRDTKHFIAQQLGSGLEWISNKVDVRLNGYLPVGKLRNFTEHRFQGFQGNQVLIKKKLTAALPSLEGEVGTSLAHPFYFAAGSYYLFREKGHALPVGDAWGWKARFDIDMGDYFSLGALVTHDRIFKTRVQGYLALNIPLGPWKSMKDGGKNLEKRRIVRNEIIPIQSRKKSQVPLGTDEEGMTQFLFVDNLAAPLGNGTIEHPFASLKEAEKNSQPGDVIYVFPGDGTPRLMDEGIILKEDQVIASAGSPLELNDVIIPAQTPGFNPTITNIHANEPIITNPGKSELSNFYYMNPWEYMRMYHAPQYPNDPSYYSIDINTGNPITGTTVTPTPALPDDDDADLADWVRIGDSTPQADANSNNNPGFRLPNILPDYFGKKD